MNIALNIRNILVFIVVLLDEAIVVVLVVWGLPRLGITIPSSVLIVIFMALGIYAVVSYLLIMRVLQKKPVVGLSSMVGATGEAVTALAPAGTVKIKGELWHAVSDASKIDAGEAVIVVAQDKLKLTVHKAATKNTVASGNG